MRGMARVATAAGAALACLVLAAPAGAVRTEVVRAPSRAPQLIDGGVVYVTDARAGTQVRRGAPGQAPLTLATLARPPLVDDCCTVDSQIRVAASGGYVAASRWVQLFAKGAEAENSFRIDAGPATGTLPTLHTCSGNRPIDVDGTRIAYVNGCTEAGGTPPVVVRDLAMSGAPVVASLPQTAVVSELDLAGQHIALLRVSSPSKAEVAVRDLAAAADAYTVSESFEGFSLQADGKLALTRTNDEQLCRVDWYSKAEPVAHRVDVCPLGHAQIAGDRLAVTRIAPSGMTLDLVGLAGGTTEVASFSGPNAFTGFDFDGSRVAYGVSGCSSSQDAVFVDDLARPAPAIEGGACPVAISAAAVRASSSGLVRVGFACKAGCEGFMTLRRDGKQVVKSIDELDQAPGSGKAPMRLTGSTRRLLRERGSLVVQARLQAAQRGGPARTFKRAIRLLAPAG